ncbi:MAG: lipopolysaccharide heptosyltransferase II [Desulfarculaceae bacterium]|nr:lipopolysaccharide heptosyltransferase II [Desulfarculaceae bacterium]
MLFESVKRILIVKPSSLGDIVHTLPFLNVVKKRFPDAQIDWIVARGLHPFLQNHPMIDRLWIIDKDRWKNLRRLKETAAEIKQLAARLKKRRYDVAVDLSGILRSGLLTYISGAPIRIGFKESDEGSPLFYTHKIHGSMRIHAIDRYLKIAAFMGCGTGPVEYPLPEFQPAGHISAKLPSQYAVMSPSAGKEANRWPAERFGDLAARLPVPAVVISSAKEAFIAREVVKHSRGNAFSIAGQTGLTDLAGVIAGASFFVSNDTGPMHIAAALDVPVFAVFGPANPVRTGPYGTIHTVIQKSFDCIPCYAQKPCKTFHFRCMEQLTVDDVLNAIQKQRKL